jgi:hypothetical protein
MNVKFGNETIDAKVIKATPRKFKLGDLIVVPGGETLRVVTVQKDIPLWESNTKTKTVVIFKSAAGTIIPVNGLFGMFDVLRPRSR